MPDVVAIPKLISAKTVAEATGLSLFRVYELAREGRLPHHRLGRSIWFTKEELVAFLRPSGAPGAMKQGARDAAAPRRKGKAAERA